MFPPCHSRFCAKSGVPLPSGPFFDSLLVPFHGVPLRGFVGHVVATFGGSLGHPCSLKWLFFGPCVFAFLVRCLVQLTCYFHCVDHVHVDLHLPLLDWPN